MNWPDTDVVLDALDQQADAYRRLAELAEQQHRHVRSEGAEDERALLNILAERQAVMDRVAALEPTLGPVRSDWPTFAQTLSDVDRKRAEALLGEVRTLLTAITEGDRDDTLVLQQRKLATGQALRATKAKTTAGRRYVSNAYGQQKSIDFKG